MRAPPNRTALHSLHGAFLTSLQLCMCSSVHQGRAQAAAQGGRRSRRFFVVRKDVRRIGGAGAMPSQANLFSCNGSGRAGRCKCRLRSAANRCAEAAYGCANRTSIRGGTRAPATRGPAARTGAGRSRVLTAAHGMQVEMSGRRHAVRVRRTGWCEVCTALSRASCASGIALAYLHRSTLEYGQALVPTG